MKFNLAFIAAAFGVLFSVIQAQRVAIGYPANGALVAAGSDLTVEIDRPNSLSGSTEVAVVIGIQSCPASGCRSVDDGVGTVLYDGPYKPQYSSTAHFKPPHQNFTVMIPSNIPKGKAQLGVVHVSLIGALLAPFLETLNVTLDVV